MIKTILIIAGVIVGAPIALFVLFVVAVIINFLIQPEMNSSGMIIECRGCPGIKNGSDKWPCNECEFRPDNRWWDPELECEILKTSRRYKKVQKKRAKERIILPPDFKIRVAKNKNLQIAHEVISGSWGMAQTERTDFPPPVTITKKFKLLSTKYAPRKRKIYVKKYVHYSRKEGE